MTPTWRTIRVRPRRRFAGHPVASVADLPASALNLALHLGVIVAWMTAVVADENVEVTNVRCRRRPSGRRCRGQVLARFHPPDDRILWTCPVCGATASSTAGSAAPGTGAASRRTTMPRRTEPSRRGGPRRGGPRRGGPRRGGPHRGDARARGSAARRSWPTSALPTWAPDDPREAFGQVLDTWERHGEGPAERQSMRVRLATWCSAWERDVTLGP